MNLPPFPSAPSAPAPTAPVPPPPAPTAPVPPPSAPTAPVPPPSAPRRSGLAVASLVLGIAGLVFALPFFPVGLLLGLVGLVLGIIGLAKRVPGRKLAVAGTVCSAVAVPLSAIVGLLWLPVLLTLVRNADQSTQSTQVANNGKQIVFAITSANIDRAASMRGEVWPVKGKWQDSNAYFANLMGDGRRAVLTGLPFSTFAGGGVEAAADAADLKQRGNVWTMLAGIGTCSDSRTPFLWTRNLRITEWDLLSCNPAAPKSWADKLDPSVKPFGDWGVVMVTKGGQVFVLRASELTDAAFLGGAEIDSPSAVEIVEPAGKLSE